MADPRSVLVSMTNGQEALHPSALSLILGGLLFVVFSAARFRWRRSIWLHAPLARFRRWHKSIPDEYEDGRTLYVYGGVVLPAVIFAVGLFMLVTGFLAL